MSGHDAEHLKALRKALLARWAHPNYVDFRPLRRLTAR